MEAPRSRPAPVPEPPPVTRRVGAWRGFAASLRAAWNGIVETALHQRNMRLHLLAGLWVALLGSTVPLGTGARLALLLCVFLVLSAEVANSALEALVDLVTRERHELARAAKDAGAGAVLVLAAGSVTVLGLVLLQERPALATASAGLWRQLALAVPLTLAMGGLLAPAPRPRAVDLGLSAAGAVLLALALRRAVSAPFAALAVLLVAVAVAVAFRRHAP